MEEIINFYGKKAQCNQAMICQLKVIFQIPDSEVESMIKFKEDRIIKRLELEKKKREKLQQYGS